MSQALKKAFSVVHAVQAFPGEVRIVAAEVAVRGGLGVDRALEVQGVDDGARAQVEDLGDRGADPGRIHGLGAEGFHVGADRTGLADGVGDLDFGALCQAGGHHVLGHPAHGVGRGAVHLGRILAGERAAAVAGHAAVGVDDDLAAGQAGVAHGAADDERAGRVEDVSGAGGVQVRQRHHGVDDVLGEVGAEPVQAGAFGVLAGDDDGFDGDGPVAVVADGDLGLAVGAQVGQFAGLADLGEALGEPVRQPDRDRHVGGGFVAGVAEHQALVAGALQVVVVLLAAFAGLQGVEDAAGDVVGLLADGDGDAAAGAVESVGRGVVADAQDGLADDLRDFDVGVGGDLAGHVDQAGGGQGLHGNPGLGVLGQQGVQDGVADLVTDLVGVAFGHRLGREEPERGGRGPVEVWDVQR